MIQIGYILSESALHQKYVLHTAVLYIPNPFCKPPFYSTQHQVE